MTREYLYKEFFVLEMFIMFLIYFDFEVIRIILKKNKEV